MNKTSKKIISLIFCFFISLLLLNPVLAESMSIGDKFKDSLFKTGFSIGYSNPEFSGPPTFAMQITNIIGVALNFVGIMLVLLIIYAGYLWLSSRGNEDQVVQAKKILVSAVIGVIIIITARIIVEFVIIYLGRSIEAAPPS